MYPLGVTALINDSQISIPIKLINTHMCEQMIQKQTEFDKKVSNDWQNDERNTISLRISIDVSFMIFLILYVLIIETY